MRCWTNHAAVQLMNVPENENGWENLFGKKTCRVTSGGLDVWIVV